MIFYVNDQKTSHFDFDQISYYLYTFEESLRVENQLSSFKRNIHIHIRTEKKYQFKKERKKKRKNQNKKEEKKIDFCPP